MWFYESYYDKNSLNNNREKQPRTSEKLKKIWRATVAWLILAMSQPSDASFINWYDTNYYEKYNPNTPSIHNIDSISSRSKFFIGWWKLKADGIVYDLVNAKDIELSQKRLKEYDLETIIVNINGRHYKAHPSFKELSFEKNWKKWIFWYTVWKRIILVYVPYRDKIKVIWQISQGQFIEENKHREYTVWVENEAKRQIAHKIFSLLWVNNLNNCNIKSDNQSNNYFYKDWKLIGIVKNFWSEKMVIKKQWSSEKHIATIKIYNKQIIMIDRNWNIIFESNWDKNLKINLETLWYEMLLKIHN